MVPDRTSDFGGKLREARERRGISLRQIANATKISVGVLEALERNDISRLPGGIFGRAFVRSYAVEVGLDPEQTIQDFIAQFPHDRVGLCDRQEIAPGLLPEHRIRGFVELSEAGRHAGLDRTLAKEVRAERVNGAGEKPFEIRQRGSNPGDAIGGIRKPGTLSELILEGVLKTATQFRGRFSCEGDRRHVLDLIHAGRDARGHPPRHLVGFS